VLGMIDMNRFAKCELEEIFREQNGEVKKLEAQLDDLFPFKYFLNYSAEGEKANIDRLVGLHRRHSINVAKSIRGHFLPLLFVPVNGEREHLHAQGRSDKPIPIRTFRQHWGILSHGTNVCKVWDEGIGGDDYIFLHNQWQDDVYPYCGCNKQPCRSKKGQHCIHRNILDELKLQ